MCPRRLASISDEGFEEKVLSSAPLRASKQVHQSGTRRLWWMATAARGNPLERK